MADRLDIRTLDDRTKGIPASDIDTFAASLRGEWISSESPAYDEERRVWNAMIDRRPAAIVSCRGASDAMRAVRFASERGILVSVRGAGHNIAGKAVADGGLMIDLSHMRAVRVDPDRRLARVEAGATLGDFDEEAQTFGLATPVGINSTTGIAGLTLGGGFGWLSRKYGLTVDSLRSADVVTAEGRLVTVSADHEPDLYWGVRGGGGNLGIVTSFEFELHPVGPILTAGLIVHPIDAAGDVLSAYRDFAARAPDDLSVWAVLRKAPPLPFLPDDVHGSNILILAACYAGDLKDGERLLAPLRTIGEPIADVIGPHAYVEWQKAFDPLLTPGARNYWKSHNFTALSDGLLQTLVEYGRSVPTPDTEIFLGQLGGAINRVGPTETAYPHRDVEFVANVHARWEREEDDERCVAWARECFDDMGRYATGGVYVNFIPEDEQRVPQAYGVNHERLARLKAKYDPGNLFRLNQNVVPSRDPNPGRL